MYWTSPQIVGVTVTHSWAPDYAKQFADGLKALSYPKRKPSKSEAAEIALCLALTGASAEWVDGFMAPADE